MKKFLLVLAVLAFFNFGAFAAWQRSSNFVAVSEADWKDGDFNASIAWQMSEPYTFNIRINDSKGKAISLEKSKVYYKRGNDKKVKTMESYILSGNETKNFLNEITSAAITFQVSVNGKDYNFGFEKAGSDKNFILYYNQAFNHIVFVEGGTFNMGGNVSTTVSDFYIVDHEVTQAEYKKITGKAPSDFKGEKMPVEQVSWYDAIDYCNALSKKEKLKPVYSKGKDGIIKCDWKANGYRLPTEAEWEWAFRGGVYSENYKYSGSDKLADVAWFADNSKDTTHDVMTLKPNELGIYDMSGNLWEWCWDWSDYLQGESNPKGPDFGDMKIIRGGSWLNDRKECCEFSYRGGEDPKANGNGLGFRVARSI